MKKLLSVILAVMLVITACPLVAFADGHTVRTQALVLGSESMSNEEEGWSYNASTHTLVLNDVTIDRSDAECDGNCIYAADDLNIVLEGESTLKSRTVVASSSSYVNVIQFSGSLNISGTGTINIEEGNNAFRNLSDSQFVIDGGVINIRHDFDSYEVEGTSTNFVFGNNCKNTIINDGEINSDVNFAVKEINGGVINAYGIFSKLGLIINSGEINANAIFVSKDLVVNDGAVNVSGGNIKTFIGEYLKESTPFGIFALEAFEMNGGEVYTHGSAFGLLCAPTCSFNGGSFVAESEGAAVASAAVDSSSVEPSINISDNVKVAEPESYAIHSVQSENGILDPQAATNGVSIWDSSAEEPYFEFDNDSQTLSTNAAKRVVITEVEKRTLKFNDENGNEAYTITVTENDYDRLLSDVVSEQLNVPQENIYIVFGYCADDTVSKYLELVDGMAEEGYNVNGELIIDTVWGTGETYNPDWLGDYENTSEYHIKDARDFAAFKKSCFVDGNRFEGKTIYLDNDVDLGEHFWYVGASKVVTDDGSTNYPKFSGVFDGGGHTVTGLKMFPVGGIATAGLFPFLKNAVVKNLSVDGVAMRSNLHWLGLLAGYAVDSAVYNCFASGTIECVGRERNYDPGSTGALIGEAQHCAVINCGADADISLDYEHIVKHNYSGGMPKLGALIGEATTKVEESFCVINCYSHGSISVLNTFQSAKVGGLIGVADDDLYNCYTDVQLTPNRPYDMYGTLIGELHASNVLNNAGQDGENLGQYIIGNLFYPQGAQPFGWNNSVFHNTPHRDVSEFATAFETAEELCEALNAGTAQVDEIISAHRDVLAESSWADLLEQCNASDIEAKHWCISEADNMPTFGYSYKGFVYTVNDDNEVRIDGYDGSKTDITIPSEIFGMPVTSIKKQAFKGTDLSTVVIPSGVTSIGDEAFIDCKELTSVDIPDTVSYIGYGAFMRCEKLTDITLPSGITKIKHDTFNGCKALKSIVIPGNVEDIFGYAFAGCLALESVTFNDGLKNIALDAFNNCSALTSIDIPDSVTEIGNAAFFNCTNLADINIPNSVISIGHSAFKNTEYYFDENNWENNALYINNVLIVVDNKALEGEFEVKDSTRMIADYALFGCLKVTSLVLPGSVTHYGDSSLADMGILTLKIPEGAVVLGRGAINSCFDLEELTVPTSVTSIGSAFASNCHSLTDVYYLGTAAEWELIDCNEYSSFTTGGTSEVEFHFADDEPELITGWQYIDGDWYYFDAEGEIVTGWLKDGGKWYFLDEDGVMQTGWIKDGSTWYYLNKSGAMQTGWLKDGNNWYYLKANGAMATGWIKDGGKWYYLKSSGAMHTGWLLYKNDWYYLDASGAMRTANLTYKGKVYKFNASGVCLNP